MVMTSENLTNNGRYFICCNTLNEIKPNPLEDEESYQCICAVCGEHWWIERVAVTPKTLNKKELSNEQMPEMLNS